MPVERTHVEREFLLRWVLASAALTVVVGVAGNSVGRAIADAASVEPMRLAHPVGVAAGAASVGVMQWLFLRYRVCPAGLWTLIGTAGFGGAWVVGHDLAHVAHLPATWVSGVLVSAMMGVGAAVGGAVAGVITVLVLVWASGRPVAGSLE